MRSGLLLVLAMLAACTTNSSGPFLSHVDESSGQTVTHAREPLQFVVTRPGLSHVGKDYLILTPLRANVSGVSRDYLYFALATSIDRELTNAPAPDVERIVLRANEQLMSFETTRWAEISDQPPFDVGLNVQEMFIATVTDSEMALISRAASMSAWVLGPDDRSAEFQLLSGESRDWVDF